jgi:hypothetical protein
MIEDSSKMPAGRKTLSTKHKSIMVAATDDALLTGGKDAINSMMETCWTNDEFTEINGMRDPETDMDFRTMCKLSDDGEVGMAGVHAIDYVPMNNKKVYENMSTKDPKKKAIQFGPACKELELKADISDTQRIWYCQFSPGIRPGVPADGLFIEVLYPDEKMITFTSIESSMAPVVDGVDRVEMVGAYKIAASTDNPEKTSIYLARIFESMAVMQVMFFCCMASMKDLMKEHTQTDRKGVKIMLQSNGVPLKKSD